jgi:hypothetical protein
MFLLDDILLAPLKGVAAICRTVQKAAEEDLEAQEKAILAALSELYQQIEAHQITDGDFNARESDLIDRLERVRGGRDAESAPESDAED